MDTLVKPKTIKMAPIQMNTNNDVEYINPYLNLFQIFTKDVFETEDIVKKLKPFCDKAKLISRFHGVSTIACSLKLGQFKILVGLDDFDVKLVLKRKASSSK